MNENKKVYVHYGCKEFDKRKFGTIMNRQFFNKPSGGFWASPVDAPYGWKDWNERNDYASCNDNNKVEFVLKPGTKILELHCERDAKNMIMQYQVSLPPEFRDAYAGIMSMFTIDFEAIAKEYDAIEYFLSDDWKLYDALYRWDCDSIIIFRQN